MFVIHGVDRYGKVDAVDGEYLVTRFHHIFGIPLIPIASEWITGQDRIGLYGHACRLSSKSIVAAYARTWGLAIAVVLGVVAVNGPAGLLVPAALLVALAVVSLSVRRLTEPRGLRRVALQRPVLGIALDPLQLPTDTAMLLLDLAQKQFDAMSGGRTAFDVAQRGAASDAEAAHAFVVLRLVAATQPGRVGAGALDASERLLAEPNVPCVAGGPYRAAPMAMATKTSPLLASYLLSPHRWHGVVATLVLWALSLLLLPCEDFLRVYVQRKVDIARSGVKKLAYESFPQWQSRHGKGRCPTVEELAEFGGSIEDPWGTPYLLRCACLPTGAAGVAVWSAGEDKRDDAGAGDDIASWAE